MARFYLLCGLPASGKSTFANKLKGEDGCVILSSDALRQEMYGDYKDQEHNNEVFQELQKRLKSNLSAGKNVVMDACNISYKRRKALVESLNKIPCEKICYLMTTPYNDCIKFNSGRDNSVPVYAIKRMYLNFYVPQYYEGWNDIRIHWNFNERDFNEFDLFQGNDGLDHISQDNPHHTLTIGEHCKRCFDWLHDVIPQGDENPVLCEAALFHDIGKKFTKQFKNAKGEPTEIAHYYNHMNVSAYDALFYTKVNDYSDKFVLGVSNYIQWHMQPFFLATEKSKQKFIRLVGKEFFDNLMLLHDADVHAK